MEDDERRVLWRRWNDRFEVRQQVAFDYPRRIGASHIDRSAQLFSHVLPDPANEQFQPFNLLVGQDIDRVEVKPQTPDNLRNPIRQREGTADRHAGVANGFSPLPQYDPHSVFTGRSRVELARIDLANAGRRGTSVAAVANAQPRLAMILCTSSNSRRPRSCASSRWRKRHTVVSSGTGSRPRSIVTKPRIAAESYSAFSTTGPD